MAQQRMSYRSFREDFLLQLAIQTAGDFDLKVIPSEVATHIEGSFPQSWLGPTAQALVDQGMLAGLETLSDSKYSLTPDGLERAEQLAHERAFDLWEEISERAENEPDTRSDEDLTADETILEIDPASRQVKAIESSIDEALVNIEGQNELVIEIGAEGQRRIAELRAGRLLLDAEQADKRLLKRLLLDPLLWLLKKVRDEATGAVLKRIIALVLEFLGMPPM